MPPAPAKVAIFDVSSAVVGVIAAHNAHAPLETKLIGTSSTATGQILPSTFAWDAGALRTYPQLHHSFASQSR
jgi:hypothetical protein